MDASFRILCNALGQRFDSETLILQVVDSLFKILLGTDEIKDQQSFATRQDLCLEYIEGEVVILCKAADDWFVGIFRCIVDDNFSRIHIFTFSRE